VAQLHCDQCNCEVKFLRLHQVMITVGVCRSTVYYWMQKGWIHWRELPSGRRLICLNSIAQKHEGERTEAMQVTSGAIIPTFKHRPEAHK
jgi:predicted DNA-binding transcriptional regulator AlpA